MLAHHGPINVINYTCALRIESKISAVITCGHLPINIYLEIYIWTFFGFPHKPDFFLTWRLSCCASLKLTWHPLNYMFCLLFSCEYSTKPIGASSKTSLSWYLIVSCKKRISTNCYEHITFCEQMKRGMQRRTNVLWGNLPYWQLSGIDFSV